MREREGGRRRERRQREQGGEQGGNMTALIIKLLDARSYCALALFPKLLPMQLLLDTVRAGKEPRNKSPTVHCIDRGYTKKKGTHFNYDGFSASSNTVLWSLITCFRFQTTWNINKHQGKIG